MPRGAVMTMLSQIATPSAAATVKAEPGLVAAPPALCLLLQLYTAVASTVPCPPDPLALPPACVG